MEATEPTGQSFGELRDSVTALITTCIEFGGELVQAVPRSDDEDSSGDPGANLKLVDEALTAYFSSAFDLKRRNAQTQFSVAIIALAKSGALRSISCCEYALTSSEISVAMCAVLVI